MHCLGAVAGSSSSANGLSVSNPSSTSSTTTSTNTTSITNSNNTNASNGNCGGVVSVVRSLGVLVCEGRIQGSPRGYKEGPHCSAPLQSAQSHHDCDKDNYLCNRYLVLIKEITERIETGTSLCIEVLMCSDCPCGLGSATSKDPVSSIPSTITQWPHSCELLLEYWRIGVVPSKSSEMMNSQGLYQAVRSRLHFSQIAAWWSRSNGSKPAYVATRVVPHNADNLKKFFETPVEHTFPLASIGDGNSIEVTVWALPRMEDVPTLVCPVHLEITKDLKEDKCTPVKSTSSSSGAVSGSGSPRPDPTLVLPLLVDDRLQTPCNKSGKHHCRCEDEDGCPPSPSIKPNGERKRRRSLPCGPPDIPSSNTFNNISLASVTEAKLLNDPSTDAKRNSLIDKDKIAGGDSMVINGFENRSYLNTGTLERKFQIQVNLDIPDCKEEKRYKPSSEALTNQLQLINNSDNNGIGAVVSGANKSNFFVPFVESQWPSNDQELIKNDDKKANKRLSTQREPNLIINPFSECNSFNQESNSGCSSSSNRSSNHFNQQPIYNNVNSNSVACTLHLNYSKSKNDKLVSCKIEKDDVIKNYNGGNSKELSHLMSKLSFNKEIDEKNVVKSQRDEGGLFDWISKVPGRVLNGTTNPSQSSGDGDKFQGEKVKHEQQHQQMKPNSNTVKFKNCNLELSQREFDEVLAVLRAKTPSSRRRAPVKNVRKRERCSDSVDKKNQIVSLENCLCPIHREIQRSTNPFESTICQLCTNNSVKQLVETSEIHRTPNKTFKKSNDNIISNINSSNNIVRDDVQNKADVLLNAILRTSNQDRKGLSDISNGTRPRNNSKKKFMDDVDQPNEQQLTSEVKLTTDDDKYLPTALNKRLHRFKQLFRKDQQHLQDYKELNDINLINKVKRKIDFTTNTLDKLDNTITNEKVKNETESIEQGFINNNNNNSTNYKLLNNHDEALINKDSSTSSSNYGNKYLHNNVITINEDEVSNKTNEYDVKSNILEKSSIDYMDDDNGDKGVPSAIEQERFRRSLENATSMVFHSRTGLPLTSSPAPLRRGSCCFDYDSTLNSASSKRSALFELNTPPSPGAVSLEETDREIENSGEGDELPKRSSSSRIRPQSHALLGSFEESALNGRLEPVSTVHGFTAEIGASGTFCPKHRKLPVTVFFYTLNDIDKVSTPYLAHINLGKKGYQVPRSGTIQVTLFNPLGTVVKMFVVLYDLSDMPARSHTFLRQRTLRDKTLRYLIHLRFMSGKSGRIYLHTDIRIIICRKSDVDTASDFGSEPSKELRSYIHGPTNPKFSPRC